MKYLPILICVCLMGLPLRSQFGNFEWALGEGSTANGEIGTSICVAQDGSLYVTGYFRGTTDFDPGPDEFNLTPVGSSDIFIQKLSPEKELIWVKTIGGASNDGGFSITTDSEGNVLVLGDYGQTVDFDPGPDEHLSTADVAAPSSTDIFILKLTADGDFIWVKSFGNFAALHSDRPKTILTDKDDNIYSSGVYYGTVDFDPGPGYFVATSNGWSDGFIQKLDSEGNFLWVGTIGGENSEKFNDMHINADNEIFLVGSYLNSTDFDTGPTEHILNSTDDGKAFVLKLNESGEFIWVNTIKNSNPSSNDQFTGITTDDLGNILLTGVYKGTIDFNPGFGEFFMTSDDYDFFIMKWNFYGAFEWAVSLGGESIDNSYDIETDGDNLFICGTYIGSYDFDPGPGVFELPYPDWSDSRSLFVMKLNTDGNFRWAHGIGDNYNMQPFCMDFADDGGLYSTGFFTGSPDFDTSEEIEEITSSGFHDIFVLKLNECGDSTTDLIVACDEYTWINGTTYTESNSTDTHTLTNVFGCDSIVKLNLTIISVDTSVTKDSFYLTSSQPAASYQWLDCDNDFSTIEAATNQTFIPTSIGNYAVEITLEDCIDTSECYNINMEDLANYPLNFIETKSTPAYCRLYGYQNGFGNVYAEVEGEFPDFQYRWKNIETGEVKLSSFWEELNPGLYEICVTDVNEVMICDTVIVDSLNPIASFDVISDDVESHDLGYIGRPPAVISFKNTSQHYSNPLDTISADTSFVFRTQEFEPWNHYYEYPDLGTYTFTDQGTYISTLIVTNFNGCSDTANAVTGIFEPYINKDIFTIISHSSYNQIIIKKMGFESSITLKIFSINGQLLLSETILDSTEIFNFPVARGIYIFEVYDSESNYLLETGKFHY